MQCATGIRWTLATIAVLAGGCSWQPAPEVVSGEPVAAREVRVRTPEPQVPRVTMGERAVRVAWQQIGVPYRYGGANPGGFDCSGLVSYAYSEVGASVPRTTSQLWDAARPVAAADARPGDLVFFEVSGKPGHVGLYAGGGVFIHAPSTGRTVTSERIDSGWYASRLLRFGRLPR